MSLVQGIGDEVLFFCLFMFLLIAVLIVIALRASRSGGRQAVGSDRRGVVTESSRLGTNGAGQASEDSTTEYGDPRRASDGPIASSAGAGGSGAFEDSMTTSDVAGRVPHGSRTGRVDEDFGHVHDAAESRTRLNAVTHSSSGGELRQRTPRGKFSSTHMESSRRVEEEVETSLGNIWEAAQVEDNGPEQLPANVANSAPNPVVKTEAHETVPTPEPPEQGTSDRLCISLVHLQQRTRISCSPDDTLARLAEVHFARELRDNVRARFIYCGRLLDAAIPMRYHHLPREAGIHIHFSSGVDTRPTQAPGGTNPAELDISALFLPMLGLVLCAVWAVLLWKPVLFTLLTKLMLYFLSFGFVLLLYARFGQPASATDNATRL